MADVAVMGMADVAVMAAMADVVVMEAGAEAMAMEAVIIMVSKGFPLCSH